MPELYFPQFESGALVQYPFNKQRTVRTVRNVLSDGRLISYPDAGASAITWSLNYRGLSAPDIATLKSLFDACQGPLLPFTFLDPTGNLLSWSSDLSRGSWRRSSQIAVTGGFPGPNEQLNGYRIVNSSQANQQFCQAINAPSSYQYSFCTYVKSPSDSSLILFISGTSSQTQTAVPLRGGDWTRVALSGRLNDSGSSVTAGLILQAGQSVFLYGPQLEPQVTNSPYRPTASQAAIYPNCFWASSEMIISADEPNSYSAEIEIETVA